MTIVQILIMSLLALFALMTFDVGVTGWALLKADKKYGFYERNPWEKLWIRWLGTMPGLIVSHAIPLAVLAFAGWHWPAYQLRVTHAAWALSCFYLALAISNVTTFRRVGAI